jgi:hypothetical protein
MAAARAESSVTARRGLEHDAMLGGHFCNVERYALMHSKIDEELRTINDLIRLVQSKQLDGVRHQDEKNRKQDNNQQARTLSLPP